MNTDVRSSNVETLNWIWFRKAALEAVDFRYLRNFILKKIVVLLTCMRNFQSNNASRTFTFLRHNFMFPYFFTKFSEACPQSVLYHAQNI
jgi:hypothetical protein